MLKQQIQADSTAALKQQDELVLSALRMLLASVLVKEKDKKYKTGVTELTEEEIIETIVSEIKKRKDAIALYLQGKRPELAEKEEKEIEVLQKYLPEQFSEEELKKIIEEVIAKEISARGGCALGAKDMGKVMADLSPKIKGRADSAIVSKMVKELLMK